MRKRVQYWLWRFNVWRRPHQYFRCTACGMGPWHNSWAQIELGRGPDGKVRHRMPKKPIGPCCSGAD